MRRVLGIRAQLALGLFLLLLVAGAIAAVVVTRLVAAEAEARVVESQSRRVDALAALARAACETPEGCRSMLAGQRDDALVLAIVYTASQKVYAGDVEQRAVDGLAVEALQGATPLSRRIEREGAHPRGAGIDHRVARPFELADGRSLVLLAAFSLDALHAAIGERQRLVLLYLVFDLLAVLAFGLYLGGRYLVNPIRRLTDAATTPDADVPLLEGPLELARLSRAFADLVRDLRERNAELARSADELVRSERLATVGRLAAGVAHEVGNPLASVIGYLEFLRDPRGTTPEVQTDLLARMDDELDRIRVTLRRLLDFSRPGTAEPSEIDPREIALAAVDLVRYQRKLKDVEIQVTGECPRAFASGERVRQVLINLLLNAADALQGTGVIAVELSERGGAARLEVRDDGPGVPAEHVERLFDPFFSTKRQGEGTGLGLAISQRLAEEWGGSLVLSSVPGGPGAAFALTIPTRRAAST